MEVSLTLVRIELKSINCVIKSIESLLQEIKQNCGRHLNKYDGCLQFGKRNPKIVVSGFLSACIHVIINIINI